MVPCGLYAMWVGMLRSVDKVEEMGLIVRSDRGQVAVKIEKGVLTYGKD